MAEGVSVVARNLNYRVADPGSRRSWKVLLNDVNLCVQPSHMLVIMGPSGSGKTTLLNALSGRIRRDKRHELSGKISFHGPGDPSDIRKFSSYVTQEDRLLEFLTVEETVSLAADLKLKHLPKTHRRRKVDQVLEELALDEIRQVRVGGEGVKGISGGQKKRVAIAIELLGDPSLLFLDEPTSGLDSSLAYDTLMVLASIAHSGRTVICTIHQPRSQTFALFDQLMLLNGGRIVYAGAADEATLHFSSLGHPCPPHFNPADFLLDILSVHARDKQQQLPIRKSSASFLHRLSQSFSRGHHPSGSHTVSPSYTVSSDRTLVSSSLSSVELSPTVETRRSCAVSMTTAKNTAQIKRFFLPQEEIERLPVAFASSHYATELQANIADVVCRIKNSNAEEDKKQILCNISPKIIPTKPSCSFWFSSLKTLSYRFLLNDIRNPIESLARVVLNVSYALIIGGIFYHMTRGGSTKPAAERNAQAIVGSLYFIVTQLGFGQLDALLTLPKNRAMFNRETANGLYTSSAYFLAQTISKFPFQHIPAFLFLLICYFMMGFSLTAWQFFQHQLVGALCVFASIGYCLMIGAAFCRLEIVHLVAPFGLVIIMLLAGFFILDDKIPWWIGWLKYVAFMRYAFFAFVQTEFPPGGVFGVLSSEEVWDLYSIPNGLGPWGNIGVLFAVGVGTRILAYLLLTFLNRKFGVDV